MTIQIQIMPDTDYTHYRYRLYQIQIILITDTDTRINEYVRRGYFTELVSLNKFISECRCIINIIKEVTF